MNIKTKFNNRDINLTIDRVGVILGPNNSGKTYLLKTLASGFEGCSDLFEIDGLKVYKGDYKVIFFGDEMELESELKLTKGNDLKKAIYDDILEKYIGRDNRREEFLKELNSKFNVINSEINKFLDDNINDEYNSKLKLSINIDSLDKVIEKFTDIYIDNDLLKENKSSKSSLRELLFKLLILLGNKCQNDHIVFIIDNIESFLSIESIIEVLNIIKKLIISKSNIEFIISSSSSLIYKYVYDIWDVYKISNLYLYKLNDIDNIIKHTIMLKEYGIIEDGTTIESFYEQNEHLVIDEDILEYKNKYFYPNLEKIGILYVSNKCRIEEGYKNESLNYIISKSVAENILLKLISKELVVDNELFLL